MSLYQIIRCEQCFAVNAALAQWIQQLPEEAITRRSHHLYGRYENIYVDIEQAPGLNCILAVAREAASGILARPVQELRIGCWLNIMHTGDVTSRHSHDDFDELLSGTYYIQAPESGAELILYDGDAQVRLAPQAGQFVFFAPDMQHEVAEHAHPLPRLSLGFNVGYQSAHE